MAARGTVVELRVHPVSGTPPAALLSCPTEFLEEVAGDKSAGFYRRQPWIDEATSGALGEWRKQLEAYSWGGLTSGPASRAVWPVFLPFIFIMTGRWSPRKAKKDELEHERYVEREMARLGGQHIPVAEEGGAAPA